ncbi:hypothetical protein Tco_1553592 [Tanacetum coccineum]
MLCFGQDGLDDFDWSNKADDALVSLALMAYKLKSILYKGWVDKILARANNDSKQVPSKSTANVTYQGTARSRVPHAVLSQSTGRPYHPRMDNIRPRTSSFSPSSRSSTTRTPHRPLDRNPEERSQGLAIINSGCTGEKEPLNRHALDYMEKVSYVEGFKFNLLSVLNPVTRTSMSSSLTRNVLFLSPKSSSLLMKIRWNHLFGVAKATEGMKLSYGTEDWGIVNFKNNTRGKQHMGILARRFEERTPENLLNGYIWSFLVTNLKCEELHMKLLMGSDLHTIRFHETFGCPSTNLHTLRYHLGSQESSRLSSRKLSLRIRESKGKRSDWMFELEIRNSIHRIYIPLRPYASRELLAAKEFHCVLLRHKPLHDELISLMHQESLAKAHNDDPKDCFLFEEERGEYQLAKGKRTDSDDDISKDGVFSTNSFDARKAKHSIHSCKGYRQEEGVEHDEVFAKPSCQKLKAIKTLFWHLHLSRASLSIRWMSKCILICNIIRRSILKILCKRNSKMSSLVELTVSFWGLQVKQTSTGIFLSQDKYVKDILNKFDFRTIKPASTPIEAHKSLGKDEEGEDVDVHLYRYQVTPKRFLIYMQSKGSLVPQTYNLNGFRAERSTSGLCQYLGRRLVSWQCKKQIIVAISSTEAEYVAAASCCAQVFTFMRKHDPKSHLGFTLIWGNSNMLEVVTNNWSAKKNIVTSPNPRMQVSASDAHNGTPTQSLLLILNFQDASQTSGVDEGNFRYICLEPGKVIEDSRGQITLSQATQIIKLKAKLKKTKIQAHPFLMDIVDKELRYSRFGKKEGDETEEVNIEEKEALIKLTLQPKSEPWKTTNDEELARKIKLNGMQKKNRKEPSKKPKLRTETIDELRNYLRVVDFEKNAQDRESLEGISMITELASINHLIGMRLISSDDELSGRIKNEWEIIRWEVSSNLQECIPRDRRRAL